MEWWLLSIVFIVGQARRNLHRYESNFEAFASSLRTNKEELTETVAEAFENADAKFNKTTKTIIAPIISYTSDQVTFSLNSLDSVDEILSAKLILPTFWAPKEYPYSITSIQVEVENDFFLNSSTIMQRKNGIITYEMKNPATPKLTYRRKETKGYKVTFFLTVTARTFDWEIRPPPNGVQTPFLVPTGPLVTVEPTLVVVARSCLRSTNVTYHLAPYLSSVTDETMPTEHGEPRQIYRQFKFKNTRDLQVIRAFSDDRKTDKGDVSCWKPVKETLRLVYTEKDRWNKTSYVSKWICRKRLDGRFVPVMVRQCEGYIECQFNNSVYEDMVLKRL